MPSLGLRHAALNVADPQNSKMFYRDFLGMTIEWEPDHDNVYLTSAGQDNLALHKSPNIGTSAHRHIGTFLDHLGFAMSSPNDVDELYAKAVANGYEIVAKPKQHRDGAYSFYLKDPDGIVVQIIHHPRLSDSHKSCAQGEPRDRLPGPSLDL